MIKLDLLDVLNGISLEASVMINLDGELVHVRSIEAGSQRIVLTPDFDFGDDLVLDPELTVEDLNALDQLDEHEGVMNLPEPGEDPHDYAERLFNFSRDHNGDEIG